MLPAAWGASLLPTLCPIRLKGCSKEPPKLRRQETSPLCSTRQPEMGTLRTRILIDWDWLQAYCRQFLEPLDFNWDLPTARTTEPLAAATPMATTAPPSRVAETTYPDGTVTISGSGQCFGDLRWAADASEDEFRRCPTLHLRGRYRPVWDFEGVFTIQPWREPAAAQSLEECWYSNGDMPIFDPADCPGPQFLGVNTQGCWAIRFVPKP